MAVTLMFFQWIKIYLSTGAMADFDTVADIPPAKKSATKWFSLEDFIIYDDSSVRLLCTKVFDSCVPN